MKVLVTDMHHSSIEEERKVLEPAGVVLDTTFCRSEEDLILNGRGAFAFLVSYAPVTRRVMEQLPELKIIVKYGVGTDNVDVKAARELGKVAANVPDYCVEEVTAHALALVLAGLRMIFPLTQAVKKGRWIEDPSTEKLRRPTSLAAGIVGLGRIGRRAAECLQPLVAKILFYDPYYDDSRKSYFPYKIFGRKRTSRRLRSVSATGSVQSDWEQVDSLTDLIERCQILSLHAPLNEETHDLIDMKLLVRANTLILVNTSRAALINREALESALADGRVSFFGSDVFWQEPPDYSDPRTTAFLKRRDVLVTPHMAWYSGDSEREVRRKAAEEILRVLQGGQPLHGLHPA
jgi:D-3-phosphoglycerate dehydrogenase